MAASSTAASIRAQPRDKRRDPVRDLETERDRRRGLEECPPQHDCAGVAIRQLPKLALETIVVGSEDRAGTANREGHRRIRDILTRRAEMHVPGALGVGRVNARGQRLDQRNRNRPRRARIPGNRRGVDTIGARGGRDRGGGARGNHAGLRLRPSEGGLEIQHRLHERAIRKDLGQRVGRRQTVDQP